ncbi:mannosyltransferase [Mycobacterium sp. NPDC006124]|uniref:mannosyltransferase n=1 Tax=Mycobacterium sp. NPDC006124 TaxID=3156729 RepID=UPI0033B7F319
MTDTALRIYRRPLTAPLVLVVSATVLLAVTVLTPNNLVDLHVYVLGGAALEHPHTLYTFVYSGQSPMVGQVPSEPLPFIYPPFAAMMFYPLSVLPFVVAGLLWQLAILAAVYGIVRITQLLMGNGTHREAMLWTAGVIWLEPIRVCLNFGQLGVFLTLAGLYAVYSRRWWVSGLMVGLAAGVKLTPAITGVYLVGVRRWAAAVASAVVFFATIAVSVLVVPTETRFYFTGLISRFAVPVGTASNQSWRGAISRIAGHDVGRGIVVIVLIIVTAVVALLAWRALGGRGGQPRDHVGSLLVVQVFGLLVSPISWVHHWPWLISLIIWLFRGSLGDHAGARVLGWIWLAVTLVGIPTLLAQAEPSVWQISRPWYLAWAAVIYAAAAIGTLGWIVVTGRRVSAEDTITTP